MDLSQIPIDQILSNGVFATLFVWLLYTTNKQSLERENKLSAQIDKQNEQMGRIVRSLERLEQQISNIERGE